MKILKNGELIDGDVTDTLNTDIEVHDSYLVKRKMAYELAGVSIERVSELIGEIKMYELEEDTINAQEKQAELNAMLLKKSEIRQLYPKPLED